VAGGHRAACSQPARTSSPSSRSPWSSCPRRHRSLALNYTDRTRACSETCMPRKASARIAHEARPHSPSDERRCALVQQQSGPPRVHRSLSTWISPRCLGSAMRLKPLVNGSSLHSVPPFSTNHAHALIQAAVIPRLPELSTTSSQTCTGTSFFIGATTAPSPPHSFRTVRRLLRPAAHIELRGASDHASCSCSSHRRRQHSECRLLDPAIGA
jgi:hypothetical protein